MDALAVGAEIGGIIAGLAILVSFGLWVTRQARAFIDAQRREREQTQAAVAYLNAQVSELQQTVGKALEFMDRHMKMFDESVDTTREFIKVTKDASDALAAENQKRIREVKVLQQQVAELDKGWLRLGGKQKVE